MPIGAMIAAMLTIAPFGAEVEARDLVFAADEWCPVNCEPGSENPGYMVEITRAVFEPLGYTVTYETINWSRALLYARQGRYDGVFAGTPDEAPGFVFPEEPQGRYIIGLFARAGDPWTYEGAQSLSGKVVGMVQDYSYGAEIESQIEEHAIKSYSGGDTPVRLNIRKLMAGRIDLVVEDVNSFRATAQQLGVEQDTKLEETFLEDDLFLALSPAKEDSRELADHLDAGIRRLRDSGELDRIMRKYGLRDWNAAVQ
ncbi:substrate-binding periplasmic protein [Roseibium hamelinense]|nr:transporter substrate-binding domain-containing protein [Roseibium hamelinense]